MAWEAEITDELIARMTGKDKENRIGSGARADFQVMLPIHHFWRGVGDYAEWLCAHICSRLRDISPSKSLYQIDLEDTGICPTLYF